MTHPIDNAFKRISNFSKSRDVPLDMPYKADKVLGYDTDRERFSRGPGGGESIQACWQWDQDAPSEHVMSLTGPLPNVQAQPEQEYGAANWTFPNTHLSNDAVLSTVYSMLPDRSWFRLLILQPSTDFWAPIQCQLRPFKRSDVCGQYEALSYAWNEGDPKYWWEIEKEREGNKWRPQRLTCNEHEIPVKGNLGSALIHLRHPSRTRAIWIDALCINQRDTVEVAEQIQTMREIYRQAYRTIVWLGMMSESEATLESDTHSLKYPEAAIASLCHIVKQWDPSQPVKYFVTNPTTWSVETKESDPDCSFARNLSALSRNSSTAYPMGLWPLIRLFQATWFSRKWVIQEVAMSPLVDVLFHNCRISWRWLGLAAAVLRTKFDVVIRKHGLYNVYHAYLIFRLWESSDFNPSRLTFVEILRLTAGFMTSEPKDIFFAVLGLETSDHYPEHRPLLKADYRLSYEDICISFARSILEASRSGHSPLAMLLDAGISDGEIRRQSNYSIKEQSTSTRQSMPSWVPSWKPGRPSLLSPSSLDDRFEASNGLEFYMNISSPAQLKLHGIHISTVLWTSDVAITSENGIASSIDWLSKFPFTTPIKFSHLKVYSRTLCAGRDSYGSREHDHAAMVLPFVAFAIYGAIPDLKPYHWINTARQTLPKDQQDPWNHEESSAVGNYRNKLGSWNKEWVASRERFGHVAGTVARGRRLFLTAAGHVGLGPCETAAGDSVCVVGGCSMPLVLRSGDGQYDVLVGPCYVDDIMDGEAVNAVKSGERLLGPLWSNSFRLAAAGVETYSAPSEHRVQQIVIQ